MVRTQGLVSRFVFFLGGGGGVLGYVKGTLGTVLCIFRNRLHTSIGKPFYDLCVG